MSICILIYFLNVIMLSFRVGVLVKEQAVLGGIVVIVLAIGAKFRGFKPRRGRWIFKGDKNL
jgi:hypothetical protein